MTGMAYTLASWRNNSPPPSPSDSIFKLIAFNFIFILHIFCCSFFNLYIIVYSLIFCYFPPTIFSHKNAINDAILYQFCLKFLLIMITTSCITLTRWSRLIWDPTAVWMLTFFFATFCPIRRYLVHILATFVRDTLMFCYQNPYTLILITLFHWTISVPTFWTKKDSLKVCM